MKNQSNPIPESVPAPVQEPKTTLSRLLASVEGVRKALIVMHDHPDPDAISSAAALKYLLRKLKKIRATIVYGGSVVRPENRAMIRRLKIKILPIQQVRLSTYKCFAVVDSQPAAGNNSLPPGIVPTIIIDHHPLKRETCKAVFYDLRKNYGATATILTEYLLESGLPIPVNLATALFYGIASETQDLGREAGEPDNKAYLTLFPKANKRILSSIRYAPLSRDYIQYLEAGLRNCFMYKNVIGTRLGEVNSQDIVPLIADLLLRVERITWSMVLGRFDQKVFVSIRSSNTRAKCGKMLRRILPKKGSAGGHDMMAGGFIPVDGLKPEQVKALEDDLFRKFLARVGHQEIQNFDQLVTPDAPSKPQSSPPSPSDSSQDERLKPARE